MYKTRCIDKRIELLLKIKGAINIRGIKWCGKTTTGKHFSNSQIYLNNPSKRGIYEIQINNDLNSFLDHTPPLLIDDWNEFKVIWDGIKFEVDQRQKPGQFILTGSTSLSKKKMSLVRHSGIGRISNIEMTTMSLYETNDSNGKISLNELFTNENINLIDIESDITISQMAYLICRGGWPESLNFPKYQSLEISRDYYNSLVNEDFYKFDGVKRDKNLCDAILKSLSRNISTSATIKTITDDIIYNREVSRPTIYDYINVLNELYVIKVIENWNYKLRSSYAIRKTHTRYFTDPSIATAALKITPEKLLDDFNTFGLFFENLCIRDLLVYASCIDANIYKYQDRYGLEVDAIIEIQEDIWGAFEIKLEESEFDKAASNLLKLNQLMIENKKKKAKFLAILTGTKYAYKRADGVLIIPIGCLKD